MLTDKTVEILTERYQKKDMEIWLKKEQCQSLFLEAVKDYFPKLKQRYADQTIYGISFEIGNTIQKVYYDSFKTQVYFNTEEDYQENIEDCEKEEESYYRFEAWAEWNVECAQTPLFEKMEEYLEQNSLYMCSSITEKDKDKLEEAAFEWYYENTLEFEEAFEDEAEQIRMWAAEALGKLRKEGFWEQQGSAKIYVIPFGGEDDIESEELLETYHIMDAGCHGTEYEEYIASLDV